MPKISIIIPVYNAEKYLAECVDSILSQTYQDLEIILVDDGSPDNCPMLCDQYAAKDARVRVIHKENGGVSTARNAGLDIASGDYITFVDSDDWLDANMYAAMMAKACGFDSDVVMCDCLKEYPDRSILYSHEIRSGFYDRKMLEEEYFPHLLMMENLEYPATISNCLLLFRRELANDVRYLIGVRYSEDLLFGAQILYHASSFYYMKENAFYHYRMNPISASHSFVPDRWKDYLKLHSGIQATFKSSTIFDFSHQIDLCLLFFLHNTLGNLYSAPLDKLQKETMMRDVLNCSQVRNLFRRFNVLALPIANKLKILTFLYRYQLGCKLLIAYFSR